MARSRDGGGLSLKDALIITLAFALRLLYAAALAALSPAAAERYYMETAEAARRETETLRRVASPAVFGAALALTLYLAAPIQLPFAPMATAVWIVFGMTIWLRIGYAQKHL